MKARTYRWTGRRADRWTCLMSAVIFLATLTTSALAAESAPSDKKLARRGAQIWSQYCGRCHNARPGGEFNRLEWDTLMLHMRVRANLPAGDSEALRVYLRRSH